MINDLIGLISFIILSIISFILGIGTFRFIKRTKYHTIWILVIFYAGAFVIYRFVFEIHFVIQFIYQISIVVFYYLGSRMQFSVITGPPCSGKNIIAEILAEHSFVIVDIKNIIEKIIKSEAFKVKLSKELDSETSELISTEGDINMDLVYRRISVDEGKKEKYHNLFFWKLAYNLLKEIFISKIRQGNKALIVRFPQFFEIKLFSFFAFPIIVAGVETTQVLMDRIQKKYGVSKDHAQLILNSQIDMSAQIKYSDVTIFTDKNEEKIREDTMKLCIVELFKFLL